MKSIMFLKSSDNLQFGYFSSKEFVCKCGQCPYLLLSEDLVDKLNQLRSKLDKPIHINSGYRCYARNFKIGGAPFSMHVYGMAADISISDLAPKDFINVARTIFKSIGTYSTHLHVDVRGETLEWDG